MVVMTEVPPVLPAARRAPLRLYLLGRSTLVMVTSLFGAVLFSLWVTFVAASPLTVVAPLVLPVTALVRKYAGIHRRNAARLLGGPVSATYRRPDRRGLVSRVWTIERDPASWRDIWWTLVHAVVACATSTLSFTLFAGTLFYLIYPFLFWVTPQHVFGRPFGGLFELHSVADSTVMLPLALVSFALWYSLAIPLARAELSLTRSLLAARA